MLGFIGSALVLAVDTIEKTLGVPSTAFFGLLGVLIGAVIATAGDWILERHRDRRAERNEKLASEKNLREAARLVDEELRDSESRIGQSIFMESWWESGRQFSADVYTRHRATLAVHLTDESWAIVSAAYFGLNELNWKRIAIDRKLANGIPGAFNQDVIWELRSWAEGVVSARRELAPFSATYDREILESQSPSEYVEQNFLTLDEEMDRARELTERQREERRESPAEPS